MEKLSLNKAVVILIHAFVGSDWKITLDEFRMNPSHPLIFEYHPDQSLRPIEQSVC